jgi:photosystem II stability/assembly factor-like uncharacterized protein
VFKSTNGGESWSQSNTGIRYQIYALAIDPTNSNIIYAGGGAVFKSTNGGASWSQSSIGLGGVYALVIDPSTPTTLYAACNGVCKSTDGGVHWNTLNTGPFNIDPNGNGFVINLAIDPINSNIIYASGGHRIIKSADSGANWSEIFDGSRVATFFTLAVDPINSNTIYASGYPYDCCVGVVLKSTNGGGSWSQFHLSSSVSALAIDPTNPNVIYAGGNGVFKSTNGGQSWSAPNGGSTDALAIDPGNPTTIYAGGDGIFKSTSGGTSWRAANNGLHAIIVSSLLINPGNANVYAGTDSGQFSSADNGGSWTRNSVFRPLAIDPHNANIIYGFSSGHADLSKSTDGGATWTSANTGLDNNSPSALTIDPSNSEIIYAATYGGVFKSTDGGGSWSAIGNLIDPLFPVSLVIDPGNSQTLYAVTASYGPGSDDVSYSLYKSIDGGVHWNSLDAAPVGTVVIDPINTATIYVASGSIYRSTDGGISWTAIGTGLPNSAGSLVIDPVHPNVIYAGTGDQGVFKSVDGGGSWSPFNDGLTNLTINALTINSSENFLHAATPAGVFDIQLSVPPPNPIDDAQTFVRQQYLDFLNRDPDAGGLAYWTNEITKCGSAARCIHERRIGVSAAFFIELEFQDTGYFVYRFYRASFGRQPTFAEFTSDRSNVVGGSNLETSKQAFADAWVQRPAFLAAYPNTMSNTEVVNKLFDSCGLTAPRFDAQRHQEIQAMNAGRSRALVLRDVIEIPDFKNIPDPNDPRYAEIKLTSQYNPAFVLMQYFGYLRRDIDPGYDFWLDVLNNREPNNYRGMVCSFLTSSEYQLRFGSTVTRSNVDCGR